jgi:hypothetical protein
MESILSTYEEAAVTARFQYQDETITTEHSDQECLSNKQAEERIRFATFMD